MRVKETCTIRYDDRRQQFRVDIGITITHFGTLNSCLEWARMRAVPVRNMAWVNAIKYGNMPVQEGFA